MQDFLISLLQLFGLAWWVEATTDSPRCTYYFGPFLTYRSANTEMAGYVDDLRQEGALGIKTAIKRCKPVQLTIFDETEAATTHQSSRSVPTLSGQPQ